MPENNQLSERELEILKLLATGASNKEIANVLVISINTVKVHLRNIYGKLDVSSRTEASMWAVQNGIVPSPSLSDVPKEEEDQVEAKNFFEKRWVWIVGTFAGFMILLVLILTALNWQQIDSRETETPNVAQTLGQDRWTKLAEMNEPRSHFASAVLDDNIFVIGGETDSGLTSNVERYSVENDYWEASVELPEMLADIQAVTIGGKVYLPGGRKNNGDLSNQLLVFDPNIGIWTNLSPMPVSVSAYALVAFEGKVFLFGGWDGENYLNIVLKYDPTLDSWEEMTPMPTTRGFAGAAVSGGQIHIVGGFDGEKSLVDHEVYFPDREDSTDLLWEKAASLSVPRYAMSVTSIADIIHLVGGRGEGNQLEALAYYPRDDRWQTFETPSGVFGAYLGSEPVGSFLYYIGGKINNTTSKQNLAYQAIYTSLLPVFP